MSNVITRNQRIRVITGVVIMLILAAIHGFRLGSYLSGKMYIYYYSYASDLMLPFGVYFLLCMNEIHLRFLRKWYVKAILVFGAMSLSEILQYFEIYFFAVTFDWIDMFMYAIGTLLAVLSDILLFRRFLPYWNYQKAQSQV